jgi:hypothetical protein
MRPLKPRGIILISVIFITVLIGMYVASTFVLTQGQLGVANHSIEDQMAENTARSGVEYALARLEEDPEWRGDDNGLVVDSPDLKVREDNGNVVGLVRHANGGVSQFRLRFNYQDGNGGADKLDNPSEAMRLDSPHISVNNLTNPEDAPFPLGDGSEVLSYRVPEQTVALVVEGRVASGFYDGFDDADLNPNPWRIKAARTVESFHRIAELKDDERFDDAVSMAAKDIHVNLFDSGTSDPAALRLDDATGAGQPMMRSRGNVKVKNEDGSDGSVLGVDAQILLPKANTLVADLDPAVTRGNEDEKTHFYQLAWESVPDPASDAAKLNAGTYTYWESDGQLHYYAENYESYRLKMQSDPDFVNNPGRTTNILPEGFAFVKAGNEGPDGVTSERNRFVVDRDVQVQGVAGPAGETVLDLTILPRGGAREDIEGGGGGSGGGSGPPPSPTDMWTKQQAMLTDFDLGTLSGGTVDPEVEDLGPQNFEMTFAPTDENGARIIAPGDVRLATDIKGTGGSVKAAGEIRFVGLGFDISANPGEEGPAISLYSQEGITISTLRPDGQDGHEYTGLELKGILYSWKDIELKTGSAGEMEGVDPQKVFIQGTMVAYGANPGDPTQKPGDNGFGNIRMAGDQIELVFDPGYLVGLTGGAGYRVKLAPVSQSYRR